MNSVPVPSSESNRILVVDFGSQYTQLIARRVRECGVFSKILPFDASWSEVHEFNPSGFVLSGGPATVTSDETARAADEIFEFGVPVLGICYGMQTMAAQLGGQVENSRVHEYGATDIRVVGECELFNGILNDESEFNSVTKVWMSHGDRVITLPAGFATVAESESSPIAAICDPVRKFYGLQFHPEVTHTTAGQQIIEQFVTQICACSKSWKTDEIINQHISEIRELVGDEQVVLALSGGVDSSVLAALLHRAIGDQLTCIFVDNGLLRLNEAETVYQKITEELSVNVRLVNAGDRFLRNLRGITEPEQKRKIIGRTFIHVFQEEAEKLKDVKWLAQGTIYPDVIESAASTTGKAKVIKSHHNVGGLPDTLHLKLLEPLRDLFKDEVRKIGIKLGVPQNIVFRHPFPGPGLAVRVLGEVRLEFVELLRRADAIFLEELHNRNLYYEASQAFAVFLPVKSVGVVGDNRRHAHVIALRAVQTDDFMTANCLRIPYDVLEFVAGRIVNEIPGVSRVTYDISSKPPATIEWE